MTYFLDVSVPTGLPPLDPVSQVITTTNATFSGTLTLRNALPVGAATPAPAPTPVTVATALHGILYDLPGWPRDNPFFSFVLTLVVWTGIAALAWWLLFKVLRTLTGRTRTQADDILLRAVRVAVFVAIIAYGAVSALQELELDPGLALIISNLYYVVLIAAVFYLAWRIVREVVLRWLAAHAEETETRLDDMLLPFLNTVGPVIFFVLAFIFVLQYLGVNVGLLAASVGAVGLIVGLAFQESLSNLFSGIYLMIDPPFYENDLIILPDGKICGVRKVGLRVSQLYDMSNYSLLYVPNKQLAGSTIANITKPTVDFKVTSSVRVAYTADPARVGQLLSDIVQSHRNILGDPATKLRVLCKRLDEISATAPGESAVLHQALEALEAWDARRVVADVPVYTRLLAVRKQMNVHLADARAALLRLPVRKETSGPLTVLRQVLGASLEGGGEVDAMDAGRMQVIGNALDALVRALPDRTLDPLVRALAAVGALDHEENQLEAELERRETAREGELDQMLAAVAAASERVADALTAQDRPKEAARVKLWIRNIAVIYAEQEVHAVANALDEELGELVTWLRELERGGLTRAERQWVRGLLRQWGGLRMVERRRVAGLRRQIMRWIEWREQDTLSPSEYAAVVDEWDRRMRLLTRKLLRVRTGDEESLDNYLSTIRAWIHSYHFLEPLADWKKPGAGLGSFGESGLEFGMAFYVDDIKLEHFSRRGRVVANVLMDIWEVFQREGIEIPVPQREIWMHNEALPGGPDGNGSGARLGRSFGAAPVPTERAQ